MEFENKLKIALQEKTSEYERKFLQQSQEIQLIRKENSSLKHKILEIQSKLDAKSLVSGQFDDSKLVLITQKDNELLLSYNNLKAEQALNKNQSAHCSKCKAFIDTSTELSKKILRLREFLSND